MQLVGRGRRIRLSSRSSKSESKSESESHPHAPVPHHPRSRAPPLEPRRLILHSAFLASLFSRPTLEGRRGELRARNIEFKKEGVESISRDCADFLEPGEALEGGDEGP